MAVDIEGFDIVFSSANANHAREIDQSIARMSEKVPALSMGLSEMAKALDALGKINVDGVRKNLDAVKDSIENIDGSKLNKVFELATAKSEGLLNSVTSLVNMLGKVDMSSFSGGGKVEVYDNRSRVTTTRETGGESQNQEQINALLRQRGGEMQRLLDLQNAMNQASANQLATEEKLRDVASDNVKEVSSIEQINSSLENKKAKIGEIESAQRRYNDAVSEEAQLQKKTETLRKEISTSSESMKKADRLRQELKLEEEVCGNAEKILSTERERNVVTAEYEAIKKKQADSEAARMKQLEATMKKYQAEYDNFAAYEQEAFGGKGRTISQYWQDAIQQDKKGVIAFLKAREEYQRRIEANKHEIGLDRSSYVAPSADGYLNELDVINKKIKEVKEQYNETVKDLDKLNQAEEIAFHAQNRDAQLKELEAKKAIIKQLTEEYGEVARAKERAESVPEVSKSELDSAKKQQSLKQELETLDAKIGKVDELRQKEKTLADAEDSLMSAIRDKKRYEEQLGTDNGESRLAVLRAEHDELAKHKADIEAKTLAEQKLIEQFEAEKKVSEQAKQAFAQAGGEKRLAELKAETTELEKQKALIAQSGSPTSNAVTAALEKEKQLEQDIARFKKEATDQDAKHKELLERIVSLKEKQGSLMDMSKTKNQFQDIRTLQELIIKESKKIGVEGIGGQFQFSDSQRKQLEEQIAKIFKTSTNEAEKMIRGAVMGGGDLMSGVWGKQNDTFFANFQINEENIKRLRQERKQVTQELTQAEQQNEQAVLAKQAAERSAIATEEQLIKARENRLKIEQELAKQKPTQSEPKATPSPSQVSVIPVKLDEKTILSEIKNISDQLATLFKDIPVSLKKELDLTFFAEKANELKKMFDGITVTGIQPTPAKKTENTVSNPLPAPDSPNLSTDSAMVIEAAFERMNNLTNALIDKIRSIGTAENELFTNLRTDIQGVSTSLQGLVEQLSKVQEKSTRKKSAKKDDDAIVTEREVALTKEELARLDDLNAKLAKSNDLLAKKRAEQDAVVKTYGTRDMFIDEEISRLETEIKAYNKAKQDLLVPKHGVAPSQSLVETEKAENSQLKLVKGVEEEANARQKNIAYLTQMISLIERMLKYGNFGQGVDMFSGMQQYLVDVQGKMKELLKEQRTTTDKQIAQQDKANRDMAMSYLGMINEQIEAGKRKEREEQAYRERVLAAERAYYKERQRLYVSLYGEGGEKDKQDAQIKKAQQWYTRDAEMRQKAEEEFHKAIQILIAKAEAQRIAAKEHEDRVNEQFYEKDKKRLYELYQEQLKLKGKIGSLDNQRTIVSERSQGTITALSPKQEQLAQEYAQQLAKVNAEISRTASLVGYVDAQNAKESTRIALLEQEIKLQKELDKALEKVYAEQYKKADAANAGLSASQIKSMENEYARLLAQIDKVNAARREMNEKQGVAWSTGNTQTFAQLSSGIQAADKELNRLNDRKAQLENESQLQLDKIRETHERKRGEQAVKDFERAEREKTRIAEREAKKRADEEKKKVFAQNTSLEGATEFAKTANTINSLQTAVKYLQEALSKTAPNTPEWNNANKVYQETKKRLDDIKKSMEDVKTHTNSIIPSLKNLAMQFGLVFSMQQLNQWVQHMVDVRAQFELQNIALRSIIQNKEKADQIFAEVQQLALKSPFSIMQLNTYTKQMAAYGVEADKLVGITKQLADVSAGLGVDMGRLILAYGQVKTANYLRATEVRQFTEAGLNITQELANYFTELNGKMVTAGEVTEMITKRMVKFEDVAEVFKRVTSAGGMFYEMQEKQSEGLKGQIQRIGDAYSIMLNDIGKSNQGTIAGVLATLRELIQNWRVVAEYIKMAASAYLLYEAYVHRGTIIKYVTKLADAWQLVPKAIHGSTAAIKSSTAATFMQAGALGRLGMIANGVIATIRGIGFAIKVAFNATIILGVVQIVSMLINHFVEAKAKADQLKESLGNIDEEVSKEFNNSAAAYERLSRAIVDSSKTFDERNEAMSELKRTFKDILPDEYLQLSYIEQHAGNWNEAEKAMKQYYDSLALEKEKAAIKDANKSEINDARKDIASTTIDYLGKDFGISEGQLQTFVDNILQQMLDGSITTTEQAVAEYIRQIENWNNKSLSKSQIDTLKEKLNFDNSAFWNGTLFKKDMSDLLDIAKDMGAEFDNLAERQNHYASASEKAQTAAQKMMETRATGVKELIERAKSGLDQINAIQRQIAQVDMQTQNEETIKQKATLQERLNEAIQQERDLYAAIGIEMPKSFEEVSATTINIRDEIARVSADIANIFLDGVDPAVVGLYESYQKLAKVQSQLNDGTKRSQEEVARLRDIEVRSIDEIKSKYRQLGVDVPADMENIAYSQDLIRTEMMRVCDATREYFKTGLIDKLSGGIKTLGPIIEKFLSALGIEIHFDFPDVETNIKPALDANKKLLENKLKINDKIIKSDNRFVLEQGQNVKDYVKNLKTLKEENDRIISMYDKAKDKKQWLSLQDEKYNTEAKIQLLREQSKAAKEIAEAYDPTLFDKKGGRTRTDKTEEMARKRFEFIKRANTEYEKLLKNYDAETAKAKVLSDMMGEAKTLGVDEQFKDDLLTKASTMETLQSVYDTFYKGIIAKYPKIAMEFQKTFNGIALDIDVKLRDEDRDEIRKQMDELMGGYELAIELEKSGVDRDIVSQLFGIDTFDLNDVTKGFEKAWLDAMNIRAKRAAEATGDDFKAYKNLEEAKAKMGEEDVKLFESQQKKISDTFAKELRAREKEYAKYLKKSYSDSVNEQVNAYRKLIQLQMDADFKRNAIIGNNKLDEKQKQTALQEIDAQSSQIAAKMQEQLQEKLNKIQWEGFKDSPLFETVLSDIENLGTATLDMLINRLGELKDAYKGLDPKNIKEIEKYIDQLNAQKIKNNPFKEWGNALREINELKKKGLTLDKLNENLVTGSNDLAKLNAEIESYNKVLAIKQQMAHVTEKDDYLMRIGTEALKQQLNALEIQKSASTNGSGNTDNLDLQIEKIKEILAAHQTILASNRENVILSEKEIALLQKKSKEITSQINDFAKEKGDKENSIKKINEQIKSWKKLKDSQKEALDVLDDIGSTVDASFSAAESTLSLFGETGTQATQAVLQGINKCIQAAINLAKTIATAGTSDSPIDLITGIADGASQAIASAAALISSLGADSEDMEEKYKEHIKAIKKLQKEYKDLADAINNAFSGVQLGGSVQASIQNLEKQNEQYRAMIKKEEDEKKPDKDSIEEWQEIIEENSKKQQELWKQYLASLGGFATGSDVRDAAERFVDAWVEAFNETGDGLSGLKKEFDDFMRNIVKKQAYMKVADHWINKFGDMINAAFDKYGNVNYEKLQIAIKWLTEEGLPQMDTALESLNAAWERYGISLTDNTSNLSGLAAGIQGVTEETAQILEALLNSMRYYVADTNEQLRQIFVTMTNPNEENPFLKELKNQTKYLASIDRRLDSVISATKRASGSHINVFTT